MINILANRLNVGKYFEDSGTMEANGLLQRIEQIAWMMIFDYEVRMWWRVDEEKLLMYDTSVIQP